MKNQLLRSALLYLFFVLISFPSYAFNLIEGKASLIFDLNECYSRNVGSSSYEYSEFTAEIQNTSGIALSVQGDHLYRNNPILNRHSCTPGVDGTRGMCISYEDDCTYTAGSDKSLRFDILVSPLGDEFVQLDELNFYEKSPEMFDWLDGPSGPNNYPTQYGVRVLKNGVAVFEQSGYSTNLEWTLQQISFVGNNDFIINEPTLYQFELLAYCNIGNGSMQKVWDIDEIMLTASCIDNCQGVEGGTIEGGPFQFCVGDGMPDNILTGDITLSGNTSTNSQWVVTDEQGNILGLPPTPFDVDFDQAGTGTCLVWHLSFEDGLIGAEMGMNANELQGCYSLSNPISVIRTNCTSPCTSTEVKLYAIIDNELIVINQINGGVEKRIAITGYSSTRYGGMIYYPVDDMIYTIGNNSTNPELVSIDRYSGVANVIGDVNQVAPTQVDLNISEALEYNPDDGLVYMGGYYNPNLNDNFFSRELFTLDLSTGHATLISEINGSCQNELDGLAHQNGTMYYIDGCPTPNTMGSISISNGQQTIINGNTPGSRFENNPSTGGFWFIDAVDRLLVNTDINGMNANTLGEMYPSDAYALPLSRGFVTAPTDGNLANGGALYGGPFEYCVGNNEADFIANGSITLQNPNGDNSQWVITDQNNVIIGLPSSPYDVDFDTAGVGNCYIWNIAYNDNLNGLQIDANINQLEGCYDISNSIEVIRIDCGQPSEIVVFPNPSSDKISLKFNEPIIQNVRVQIINTLGQIQQDYNIEVNGNIYDGVNIQALESGLYRLKLTIGKTHQMISFVKI